MDWKYIIMDLWRTRNLQEWANHRFKAKDRIVLETHDLRAIQTKSGALFAANEVVGNALNLYREYDLSDIRPTDTVLDIGACVGGFSIPAAMRATEGRVIAVEPLYADELRENIALNGLEDRVTVIEAGIGSGEPMHVRYMGREKTIPTLAMSDINHRFGRVDFLKCDCEGGEWAIVPGDLHGIRRIELEVHLGRQSVLPENPDLLSYLRAHYTVQTNEKRRPDNGAYWHCHPHVSMMVEE
jgi:FkbM family methyltransferase